MSDQWSFWRAALRGERVEIRDGVVESGFYWAKASKSGGRKPVAVWRDKAGTFRCRVGAKADAQEIDADKAGERWTWFAANPVTREDYTAAYETGTWPDGTPTVAPALVAGSNLPTDPWQRFQAEVDDVLEKAGAFLKSSGAGTAGQIDKTKADMARNIQAQALALVKSADAMHKSEKQPHLDACREVDDKFRFREYLKSAANALRSVFESFMRAEEARMKVEQERAWKAEQERIAVERAKIEAEQATRMADDPIAALTSPEPELPELPPPPPPIKVNVGGGVGRAAGLRTEWVGVVTDYKATLAHFAEHEDVKALIEKLVARAVKAGKGQTKIPGVEVRQDRRAA